MSDFQIDPVKAAVMAHKNGDCDIHYLNDTCYSVCAAFQGGDSAWEVNPECAQQCEKLVECSRRSQYGMPKCDHRRPDRPVLWDQTPHYFPELYKQTRNVKKALDACNAKCEGDRLPNQCKQNCRIDSYAVNDPVAKVIEGYRHYQRHHGYRGHHHGCRCRDCIDYRGREKAHPWAFWMTYGFVIIMFAFLIAFAMKALLR